MRGFLCSRKAACFFRFYLADMLMNTLNGFLIYRNVMAREGVAMLYCGINSTKGSTLVIKCPILILKLVRYLVKRRPMHGDQSYLNHFA